MVLKVKPNTILKTISIFSIWVWIKQLQRICRQCLANIIDMCFKLAPSILLCKNWTQNNWVSMSLHDTRRKLFQISIVDKNFQP